jgi:ankyrin repeat protein
MSLRQNGDMAPAIANSIGNPNYQGPFGNTLLHGAVVSGDLREVRRLLAAGADPHIANRDGKTAVQAAAILGHEKIHELLSSAIIRIRR